MKRSFLLFLACLGTVQVAHAQEAPMDATHLRLRAFVYNAFAGIQKTSETPKYPKGTLTTAELYKGVAAGIRIRGKRCSGVKEARAVDAIGEKIDVTCDGGGRFRVTPLSGEVQGV